MVEEALMAELVLEIKFDDNLLTPPN